MIQMTWHRTIILRQLPHLVSIDPKSYYCDGSSGWWRAKVRPSVGGLGLFVEGNFAGYDFNADAVVLTEAERDAVTSALEHIMDEYVAKMSRGGW